MSTGCPSVAAQPAADDKPTVRGSDGLYEVYASTGRDLSDIRSRIEHAVDRWKKAFGMPPQPFTVVVFNNAQATRSYDYSPIRERGRLLMPWVEPVEAGAGKSLGRSMKALTTRKGPNPEKGLSHELCHKFLIGYVTHHRKARGIERPDSLGMTYGAWGVPDWLDEASALWCEGEDLRAERLGSQFEETAGARIPIPRLLEMPHPMFEGVRSIIEKRRAAQGDSSGGKRILRIPEGGLDVSGDEEDQKAFYPQVSVFTEWLVQRTGPGILRSFADAYATNQSTELVLRETPQLPDTVKELQIEWQSWVQSQ